MPHDSVALLAMSLIYGAPLAVLISILSFALVHKRKVLDSIKNLKVRMLAEILVSIAAGVTVVLIGIVAFLLTTSVY